MLGICKDLGIAPRNVIWSDALMEYEIAATKFELMRFCEGLKAKPPAAEPEAAVPDAPAAPEAAGPADPPAAPDAPSAGPADPPAEAAPSGNRRVGSFVFGLDGAIVSVDPPGLPESEWPEDILHRPLPDYLRKPPDTG